MAIAGCRQSVDSHDVYTDAGELCLGRESFGAVGVGGVEYVGNLCGDGGVAGVLVGYGDYF